MSNKQDYETKIAVITAIGDDQIKAPNNIPVDVYIQEAENLYLWSQEDKDALMAKGLALELMDDIPIRAGALREAESRWNLKRFTRKEAEKQWKEQSPLAFEFRDKLLFDLRFAFRNDDDLLGKLSDIAEGYSNADMIQDLNDLSVLGLEHPDLLAAVNFDMTLLDQAAQKADELAQLLAAATGERIDTSESKKIRDQAYTHLKEAVDEVYDFGQYVFRDNEERLKGYRSNYLRRMRLSRSATLEPEPEPEPAVVEGQTASETA
ncbi:MAG: hypothetical protein GTO45_35215 [Candidatus Aminicenantes bacterium]|nr:hypothetical protein [Candidatus Aminicenantes bacterium]NIM83936.1 hypothetical protein [Candidatus Aminicenantes bacterium]NIN23405.1 hypothetical protein [Candidatus Aminicenantes bacterium]NIN47109.1 hypothetical protein [Candidatus Aminicenantes bacterium]NIN90033.1 hypothetical protein [Candidatus Aminicenantes bacterium]